MLPYMAQALLRFDLGEMVTQEGRELRWPNGDRLGWGSWNLLKQGFYIQRRVAARGAYRKNLWEISPKGIKAARALRRTGDVPTDI